MADLRASDAERERTVAQLRGHAAAGRLTVEELDERSERAYSARTLSDLAALVADLPAAPTPAPVDAPPPALAAGGPGMRFFTYEWHRPVGAEQAMEDAMRDLVPALMRERYNLVERTEQRLGFICAYRPPWTVAVAVLFPFIGLLALLHRVEEQVMIDFKPDGRDGTRMIVWGRAPLRVRRAFAQVLE
jgi:hypothetical protein